MRADRQTTGMKAHRHADYNTSHPYWRWSRPKYGNQRT